MIDVLHPDGNFAHMSSQRSTSADDTSGHAQNKEDGEDEEAAWLQSVQGSSGNVTDIKGIGSTGLVFDIRQLRDETPTSASKKGLKGRLPS